MPDSKGCVYLCLSTGRKTVKHPLKTQQASYPYSASVEAVTKKLADLPASDVCHELCWAHADRRRGAGFNSSLSNISRLFLPKPQLVPAAQICAGEHWGRAIASPQGLTELQHERLGWKQPAGHGHFSPWHLFSEFTGHATALDMLSRLLEGALAWKFQVSPSGWLQCHK